MVSSHKRGSQRTTDVSFRAGPGLLFLMGLTDVVDWFGVFQFPDMHNGSENAAYF